MKIWPFFSKAATSPGRLSNGRERDKCRFAPEFAGLLDGLRQAATALDQASGGLEQQFLSTSSELEKLSLLGNRFVKQVEKLVGLATGQECDSSVFANATQLVGQATQFLVRCQQETVQMLERLRDYNSQIENLLGVEAELQSAMQPLKFVQTLFRVESATLGTSVQEMFGDLTKEIESLHGQVREIFGTKFKQLEQTQRSIGAVIAQLDRQAASLLQITTTQKAQIESSLDNLKREMSANLERDVRLRRLSKDLAREVEQVVMGLQFQDIISQKLQHVIAALPQIEAKFAGFDASSAAAVKGEALQFLHQSCRLEAGQVQAARDELAKAEQTIRGGIEEVLAHLTEMDLQCLSMEEFKQLTTSFDGMVQVLLETLEEVRIAVAETVAGAAKAYEMLRPLGGLASDLTATVHGLSAQIHRIGLNAEVQAASAKHERRGAGLEVLSARTSQISRETNSISEQAAGRLDAVAAGLAERVRFLDKLHTDGLTQQSILSQQGRQAEEQLHAFRDSALQALQEIGDLFEELRKQAGQTLETIQFTSFHQVTLPALRAPLVGIADTAQRLLQAQGGEVRDRNMVEGLRRDYTMESERQVFATVMSASGLPHPSPPEAEAAAGPGIEMFSNIPADAANGPVVPAPPQAAAAGENLGTNIELF